MGFAQRKALISEIEEKRKSKVITLITSDRYATLPFIQGVHAQIAADQVHKIVQHLKAIESDGGSDNVDLFIYSRGGDTNSAWPLVNSIRNYCKNFSVLIPVHAHSAATLISLGANKIVMSKTASLSPIDPTVANAFNPRDNNQSLGISVEDVASFFALAKDSDRVDIKSENNITEVFKILAEKVHPLALGNVKRSHSQIRLLARKLLMLHITEEAATKRIEGIVDELTERFYTHNHSIFREEARKIGLESIVADATVEEESLFWNLYRSYEEDMKLKEFFDPNVFLGSDAEKMLEASPVMVESKYFSSKFTMKQKLVRALIPDQAFRLQVILQSEQNKKNAQTLKAQLLQLQANFNQFRAQVAQVSQQQPGVPTYAAIDHSCVEIDNRIRTFVDSIPDNLDIKDLKKQIEFELQSLAWVDEKS